MGYRTLCRPALCLALGAALMLGVSPAWAQTVTEGKITGTVYLPTGEAVSGATARVTGDAIVAGERVVVSSEGGKFVFLSLPPGTYDLTISMDGFKTFAQENIVLTTGDIVDVKATLEIGAIEETVIVTSETPIVDTRSSTIDTTFTDELLEVVPTARSAFYDLQLTAAGMADVGADGSWLPSASAYGGAANENIFLVNGVNTTNPRGAAWGSLVQVNYNTVEEVKVLSLGSRAEYGSFSGAAIDVITKSGGNDFHGDVAYYTMVGDADRNRPCDTCFGADWLYAASGDDLVREPISNDEFNVTLGGPIVRDKLWFYAGYGKYDSETKPPIRITNEGYEADLIDVKLTGEFANSHRAWIAYHYEDASNTGTTWGDTWDPEMVYFTDKRNDTWSAQYQWVASARNILGFKYLGFETNDEPGIPPSTGTPGYINWWKWIGAQSIGLGGEFPYVEAQKSERETLQLDFSHYADNFLGTHDVKFGVQYTKGEGNWQGGYFHGYANFAYPYPWDYGPAANWWWNCDATWCWGSDEEPVFPIYNRQVTRNPWLTVREADSTGVFVDDTWVLSDRITLNLGLRWDNMTAKYGEGAVYEIPDNPGDINDPTVIRTRAGTDNIYDFDTWSPRIGFAWTITGDGKTVLRSHIGRYYAPIGVESLRRFGPDMAEDLTETWLYNLPMSEVDLNGNGMVDFDEVRPATRLLGGREPSWLLSSSIGDPSWDLEVAPGTGSPYTDQFNISLQRQLGRDFALEISYIYKNTEDLLVLEPYNSRTGEYYEWESLPYTTWTGAEVNAWQVVLDDYNGDGVADFSDAIWVADESDNRAVNANEFASKAGESADRTYQGIQLVFNKRYSNRWQMLASLNWTDTDGFAPRPVDQNWYIDGPLVMDTPFGSNLNHFVNNTEGPLLMTPEFMFKLAGSYTIPFIETDLGMRIRYDSGRSIFPVQGFGTYASWMGGFDACPPPSCLISPAWHLFMVADDPTDADTLPSTTIFDVNLSRSFRLGDWGSIWASFDVLNALNEDAANKVGFFQGDYGRVYQVVLPRTYRVGLKFSF